MLCSVIIYQSYWSIANTPLCHIIGARLDMLHQAELWGGLILSALRLFSVFYIPPTHCPHPERGHSFPPLPRWRWTLTCPHATPQPASLFSPLVLPHLSAQPSVDLPSGSSLLLHSGFVLSFPWSSWWDVGAHREAFSRCTQGWFWPDVEDQTPPRTGFVGFNI